MRRIVYVLLLCTLLAVGYATSAAAGTRKGDMEVSAAGNVQETSTEGFTSTTVSLLGSLGYFVDKNVQVGGSFLQMSQSNGETLLVRFIDGFVKYHVNPDEVAVPYVGAQGGLISFEGGGESASSVNYGFMGGVKYFYSEDVSINGEFNYRHYTLDIAGSTVDVDTTTFLVGLSLYFSLAK